MGVIVNRIKLVGSKGEKKVDALYDSGASFSFIKKDLASSLDIILKMPNPLSFETAKEGENIIVNEAVRLDFYIEGIRLSDEFFIVDALSEEVIIGAKTMQAWRLKLDFEQDRVIVDQMVTRLMLK
ncbi:retroviral-like aspartic protease [candidate division KSB1 bacterium]|nr:retroviral-like aspartic protease [candidate division KSB1 bacterium]